MRFSLRAVILGVLAANVVQRPADSNGSVSERCMPLALEGSRIRFALDAIRALASDFGGVGILDAGSIMLDLDLGADEQPFILAGTGRLLSVRLLGIEAQDSSGRGM